jgi:DNA adenine methylase
MNKSNTLLLSMMNPIIPRVGGKFKLRKQIVSMIPEHEIYIEPFVGGGSIFYWKPRSKIEVISDLDEIVYKCHLGAKECEDIEFKLTHEIFHDIRLNVKVETPKAVSIKTRILLRYSYLGTGRSYDKRRHVKDPHGDVILSLKSKKYAERLKDAIVLNESYENLFRYDSPTTFFYLDPPYENSGKTTSGVYKSIDYHKLCDQLKSIQGKFLLSINDSENIREIFKDFTIEDVPVKYAMKSRVVNELLIKNY